MYRMEAKLISNINFKTNKGLVGVNLNSILLNPVSLRDLWLKLIVRLMKFQCCGLKVSGRQT
jgi:hypothetical protein